MKKLCPEGLPKLPGVYLFKDAQGVVIYIGKAKSLNHRVRSYFTNYKTDWKITSLIDEHETIAHVVTATEHEALVLEASLIGQYQPKYNRLLKEGQPFVYILYTQDPLPSFSIVRNKKKKGTYFGPFIHKMHARKAVQFLIHTFQLLLCNKKIANGCLYYHINKCAGSCKPDFDTAAYVTRAELALNVLENNRDAFIKEIKQEIATSSKELKFERARRMLGYLQTVDAIFETLNHHLSHATYASAVAHALTPRTYSPRIDSPDILAHELQQLTGSNRPIRTIDCFDISHFQSKHIVGSCIRFVDGKPDKAKFRRFMVKTLSQQNDYAALQEIISRRYKKHPDDMPDLILIDGGIGQLNAIRSILPDAPLASLAKREERLHTLDNQEGIILDKHTTTGQTLIALRDYTHHFAITYHRLKQNRF